MFGERNETQSASEIETEKNVEDNSSPLSPSSYFPAADAFFSLESFNFGALNIKLNLLSFR